MRNIGGLVLVLAVAVFGVSAVVFGAIAVDAVRTEDHSLPQGVAALPVGGTGVEDASPETNPDPVGEPVSAGSFRGNSYPGVSNDELLAAVNQDLFKPDRTPSPDRYLLPSERMAPARVSRDDRRRREPSLRIVGTAIAGNRALAMVQPEDSLPFAVLLGEEVDGYILADITQETVTLMMGEEEFTFPVVEPQQERSSDNNRNRNARNNNTTEEAAQALSERVQQMLQGMGRGQGAAGGAMPMRIQIGNQIPGGGINPVARELILRGRGGGGGGGRP